MITVIAAMDINRVIGVDNDLPWHIPEDLQHFKRTTLNHPIIMGRKTYESLPFQPLPKRTNIVVSRTVYDYPGAHVVESVEEALALAKTLDDEIFVIGGEAIYELALPLADRLLLTIVKGSYPGNKFFPLVDQSVWQMSECVVANDEFTIVDYRRI